MTTISRRTLVGGMAAMSAYGMVSRAPARAQPATPAADSRTTPGYATARVRNLPPAAQNSAIFPDVMATFLPPTAAIPGFRGYTFAFDDEDPTTSLTFTSLTNEDAALNAEAVARDYVDQLDPRLVTETPLSAEGQVRMYATTDAPPTELPPFLHGTAFTMRDQTNAPGLDRDDLIAIAQTTLIPVFQSLPGFVLYCWFERPGGRIAINIWETAEDLAAASDALAAWRDENFSTPTASERVDYNGTIGYSTIAGLTSVD